jgi:acyl-CoA thioester hydrolase
MKPPKLTYEQLDQLPVSYERIVPLEWQDENEHMNFRYYFELLNDGGMSAFRQIGFTEDYPTQRRIGVFDREYHVHFVNEVLIGHEVSVRVRFVARGEKQLHYLIFVVNETTRTLAAMFECITTFVDLNERRSTAVPAEIVQRMDALLAEQQALNWAAPLCGVMEPR